MIKCFNTQPREGGCFATAICHLNNRKVSTHSRAKAAAKNSLIIGTISLSFNTQPREGGCRRGLLQYYSGWRFNTQPREGGCIIGQQVSSIENVSTHSRAKAAADFPAHFRIIFKFQHTAARRRLHSFYRSWRLSIDVSTHSRAKAAACRAIWIAIIRIGFNTQPREGGCALKNYGAYSILVSTHSRAKAAAKINQHKKKVKLMFQHTAARRRLRAVSF